MKILLATSQYLPTGGGIASYNQELVNCFRHSNEFSLLTDSEEKDPSLKCCITIDKTHLWDYQYCKRIVEWINAETFDLVINSASSIMPLIAPFVKVPILTVAHFVNGALAYNAGYNSDYLSAIVALSNYGKQFISKHCKVKDPTKIKVVYNFVHTENTPYKAHKETDNPLTIVYPGGTHERKSSDVVMELAYRLKCTDLDIRFIWLGITTLPSADKSMFRVSKTTQMIQNDERFTFTGKVARQKAEEIIGNCDIFLLPSRGEGCPMTLLEALRGGCIPIVSDARHGSREILEKMGCGFIVKQGSSKQLFKTIEEIVHNHSLYTKWYKKTFEYSKYELSSDKWKSQMEEIIKTCVTNNKEVLCISENRFRTSAVGYRKLLGKCRFLTICRSIRNRIKMDYLYFRWSILKGIK